MQNSKRAHGDRDGARQGERVGLRRQQRRRYVLEHIRTGDRAQLRVSGNHFRYNKLQELWKWIPPLPQLRRVQSGAHRDQRPRRPVNIRAERAEGAVGTPASIGPSKRKLYELGVRARSERGGAAFVIDELRCTDGAARLPRAT